MQMNSTSQSFSKNEYRSIYLQESERFEKGHFGLLETFRCDIEPFYGNEEENLHLVEDAVILQMESAGFLEEDFDDLKEIIVVDNAVVGGVLYDEPVEFATKFGSAVKEVLKRFDTNMVCSFGSKESYLKASLLRVAVFEAIKQSPKFDLFLFFK